MKNHFRAFFAIDIPEDIKKTITTVIKLPSMSFEVNALKLFKSTPRPFGSFYNVVIQYGFIAFFLDCCAIRLPCTIKSKGFAITPSL